jgi:hypothetical protein
MKTKRTIRELNRLKVELRANYEAEVAKLDEEIELVRTSYGYELKEKTGGQYHEQGHDRKTFVNTEGW